MPKAADKKPAKLPKKAARPKGVYGQGARADPDAPRVGLYARVSTHDQQTLPMQTGAMREYAGRRGWHVELVVEDVGSGASERPKREGFLAAARRREIDVILVWRLDRWGRSLVDLVNTLRELPATGVGFASLTEALDLTTPAGRTLAGMLAVFAEFERDILRDRVRAGIAGKHLGRPPAVRDRHRREVRRLFKMGMSKRRIAAELGISRTSVRRFLEPAAAAGP